MSFDLLTFYDEMVRSRDRLADLPPMTPRDVEHALSAMHELVFYLITAPSGRKTELPLPEAAQASLREAARDRTKDLYVLMIAVLAQKIASRLPPEKHTAHQFAAISDALDILTFDYRTDKAEMLANLRELRDDLEHRIASPTSGHCGRATTDFQRDRKHIEIAETKQRSQLSSSIVCTRPTCGLD